MRTIISFLLLSGALAASAEVPLTNWENHPTHALAVNPGGNVLAITHTADQRVQLLDVSTGTPIPVGHVAVGVDPVSARFRTASELWVVNHISDSVSIVDVDLGVVTATLQTLDEPFDVVFAGGRAFVSCSQANTVLAFDLADLSAAPVEIAIDAEDPRSLAVSPDGRFVYAAIFESGNASTILAGGLVDDLIALPNVVSDPRGPYGGVNPPPNAGGGFEPPVSAELPPAPAVGLIVRKDAGRWMDDNGGDWSDFVGGPLAAASGRAVGWDLPDRDIAVIDASDLSVRYVSGLMNIGMALAVNPGSGLVSLVGTDALNEIRFEPNVNGRFLRVNLALADPAPAGGSSIVDLNPHLDYSASTVALSLRDQSLGDPRGIVWSADGSRGWVSGMGSYNVIEIDASGARVGAPIEVGEGPTGLALDEARGLLYVWNHFAASLSVVNVDARAELERVAVFNPLPDAITAGRPLLYDTHLTSGLGHVSCASCHVDARMDRLAWDLGDPAGEEAPFDQNCGTTAMGLLPCEPFHSMKGPMTTQTLQDIIGNEPFHWRGDRAGIEAFNPAFVGLLGDDRELTAAEMQAFEDMLATVTFPPNPFREFDNSLPTALELKDHYTSGRFAMAGLPLGVGDAQNGLELYTKDLLDSPFHCASCHTLPTGMAVNGPLLLGNLAAPAGGSIMPMGPLGENHLGLVSVDGSTNVSIKVPHLRNQYDKVGFEMGRTGSRAGFGFLHDGSVDSLSRFISARAFDVQSDQEVADLIALMMAFSGSDFGDANPILGAPPPESKDSHAAVGAQETVTGMPSVRLEEMLTLAREGAVDLVVHSRGSGARIGWAFDAATDKLTPSDGSADVSAETLLAAASVERPQTWTVVPAGLGVRLGIDRDGDGIGDSAEIRQGSSPADAASTALRPSTGLWFNPARSGHGFDLQFLGEFLFVTWYTYADDDGPTWYQAAAPYSLPWATELNRFTWNPTTGGVDAELVGSMSLTFEHAAGGTLSWQLGERSGSEPVQLLVMRDAFAIPDPGGTWYDPSEPGWGLSLFAQGDVRVGVVYFYDGDNQPRWVLGQGQNVSAETLPMLSFTGFCPDCAAVATESASGGSVELSLDGARQGALSTAVFYSGQPGSRWEREGVSIVPLSDAPLHPAAY